MILKVLEKHGILGMNRRLGEFILPFNRRDLYPIVDNKIETYELGKKYNVAQPKSFYHIMTNGDIRNIEDVLNDVSTFVVKPNRGAMGNGILIVNSVSKSKNGSFVLHTSKGEMKIDEFKHYLSGILSGIYSLNGHPDQAIIQEKLIPHSRFNDYIYKGIPDVRIIVFKGYPVMAMLRTPTKESRGRANLHQGAVGCGLSIKTGQVINSVHGNRVIENHPDTGNRLKDLIIPYWKESLLLASRCYDMCPLGYLGADIVVDENRGPLLLEMNARPGLAIQTANMSGLTPRLRFIKRQDKDRDFKQRVDFSLNSF